MPDTPAIPPKETVASATGMPLPIPRTPSPHVVEFQNVTKTFNPGTAKAFTAVQDLSFTIPDLEGKGEIKAILGPSGCGKSTALNLLCGFEPFFPPTSGTILVRGEPVSGPGIDRGMVFQRYSSFPHLTVEGNVRFGLELNCKALDLGESEIADRAAEWIRKVGLEAHAHKFPHQLSGGQQQRVALARSLVLKPRILLLDEPFSALDEPTRLEMQRLLVELWHEVEATVLLITHSLSEAVYLGDEVWLFSHAPGRIVERISDVPQPDPEKEPAAVQRTPAFLECLEVVTEVMERVERETRPTPAQTGKTESKAAPDAGVNRIDGAVDYPTPEPAPAPRIQGES